MPPKPAATTPTANHAFNANIGKVHADTFRHLQRPYLRADYILANPPFNDSDWFRKDDDVRWQPSGARQTAKGSPQGERGGVHQFGVPPKGNANFAWVQHFIHSAFNTLAPLCDPLLPKLLSGKLSSAETGNLIQTAN